MTTTRPSSDTAVVDSARRYYDANTRGFLRTGHGRTSGAIHRAVWAPGVATREQAFRYVDNRVAALVRQISRDGPLHLVDLGCGVGASLCYLLQSLPHVPVGTGVTISEVQIAMARQRAVAAGIQSRASWVCADYCRLPTTIAPADVAFAIESFVHAADADAFFEQAARVVRAGGLLIICDDVLCAGAVAASDQDAARRTIDAFRRGWRAHTLLERGAIIRHAAAAGFSLERADDLTRYLELGRPRDRVLAPIAAVASALGLDSPRLGNIIGGTALQRALMRGWIAYEFLAFRREA